MGFLRKYLFPALRRIIFPILFGVVFFNLFKHRLPKFKVLSPLETIALLDDMAEKSMIRGNWRDVIEVADNLEELAKLCEG